MNCKRNESYKNPFMSFVSSVKEIYKVIRQPWIEAIMVAILVWVAFMAFKPGIINWADSHIFPLLEMSRSGWSDLLLCFAAMLCGYYSNCKTPKVISSGWLSTILCGWVLFGLFLKFDSEWTGIYLFDCHWLPYVGVLLFFLSVPWLIKYICYLCGSYKFRKKKREHVDSDTEGYRLILDSAVEEESDDRFGWSSHMRKLMGDVIRFSDKASVSVAITGSWGSGKTSYLNLLKKELDKRNDEFIILEFNPRRSASATTIQNDFMTQLRGKLSDYDCSIGSSISKYVEALKLVDEKSVLPKLVSLTGADSPDHYKKSIEEVINSTGKSLIVLIDDMDRLTGIEIMEVLKLVNLNVNFDRSIFISAFDKDYIEKALSSLVINRQSDSDDSSGIRNYTDKYFTFERPLPSVKPHKMIEYLYDTISQDGESEEVLDSNQELMSFLSSNLDMISKGLPTIRDVKRFTNLLMPAYLERKNDVIFDDFFLISLLRYSYPSTYEKIRCREIVDTNALDQTSQVFRLDSSESVPGSQIIGRLFENYNPQSAFSLNRKYFRSIRHKKAFPFYFYEYDESSICYKNYHEIADPTTDIKEAKQKLSELTTKGSDTFSIVDLIYDDAVSMSYRNKDTYKRSIELRVHLADSINNITVGSLLYMVKVMPEENFLLRLGFGEGDAGKTAYRNWLKELIENLDTSHGVQMLLQNMMYAINGPEEEVFSKESVMEMIRHHFTRLANAGEPGSMDINLIFDLLLSTATVIDETTRTDLDSDCIAKASSILLKHPKLFYPRFFQGFTIYDTEHYKVMINPNGMVDILQHDSTYRDLANNLREESDVMSKAIVHFYDNYFARRIFEWDIDYPEGLKPDSYQYNYDLMQALFARVLR